MPARTYKFRLYTAENTQNSAVAFANLVNLCKANLKDRYTIEVVDIIRHPQRTLAALGIEDP